MSLTLIRGLPGSGKSTRAKRLCVMNRARHFEADMYFCGANGYVFVAAKLPLAHRWCLKQTQQALQSGQSVVVSNTFIELWEMQPYIEYARQHGISFTVLECRSQYANIHNVPEKTISRMRARWQKWTDC